MSHRDPICRTCCERLGGIRNAQPLSPVFDHAIPITCPGCGVEEQGDWLQQMNTWDFLTGRAAKRKCD